MLDCTSRLRAARCCRSLLRDADDPFTWRCDSTLLVSAEQVTRAMHSPQRSSLSRHVETLRIVWSQVKGSARSWGGLIALVRPPPADREIEIALTNLLNKSRLGKGTNLKRVDIFAPVLPSCELIDALAALPQLESLSVARVHPPMLTLLAVSHRSLTELRLGTVVATQFTRFRPRRKWRAVLSALGMFKQLRSVLLTQPDLFDGRFGEHFCRSYFPQLRELSLCHWDVVANAAHGSYIVLQGGPSIPVADLQQGFSALVLLESLHLRMVRGVSTVLLALRPERVAPSLSRLLIEVPSVCPSILFIPRPSVLFDLIIDAPLLHTTLVLPERMNDSGSQRGELLRDAIANDVSELRRAGVTMPRVDVVPPSSNPDVWTV
jgi:hypothetical protein